MKPSRLPRLLLAAMIGIGFASAAHAQLNPFRSRIRGLTPADFTMMNQTAQRLYESENIADGSSSGWKNNQTGNSGIVTIRNTFHRHGLLCRKVAYEIDLKTQSQTRTYTLDWCKTADGSWKIG